MLNCRRIFLRIELEFYQVKEQLWAVIVIRTNRLEREIFSIKPNDGEIAPEM